MLTGIFKRLILDHGSAWEKTHAFKNTAPNVQTRGNYKHKFDADFHIGFQLPILERIEPVGSVF